MEETELKENNREINLRHEYITKARKDENAQKKQYPKDYFQHITTMQVLKIHQHRHN